MVRYGKLAYYGRSGAQTTHGAAGRDKMSCLQSDWRRLSLGMELILRISRLISSLLL